jgi:hypothetical protein
MNTKTVFGLTLSSSVCAKTSKSSKSLTPTAKKTPCTDIISYIKLYSILCDLEVCGITKRRQHEYARLFYSKRGRHCYFFYCHLMLYSLLPMSYLHVSSLSAQPCVSGPRRTAVRCHLHIMFHFSLNFLWSSLC